METCPSPRRPAEVRVKIKENTDFGEFMTTENKTLIEEANIRDVIDRRIKAVRDKDIEALLSNHAPEVLLFDVVDPLQYTGVDMVRERAGKWFSSFQSPIGYEVRDLSIATGGDAAFCHYLYHVSGTLEGGVEISMWVRATVCFRRINGKWMIVHEHQSVPFNGETGKASLDLKPE
ncbi:MAG: nuclear transport factor 2 family protein [Acidobacteriota bacterium]